MVTKELEKEIKQQFSERIDRAISVLFNEPKTDIKEFIETLKGDICFWDFNTEIYRNYLKPLETKSIDECIIELNRLKAYYNKKRLFVF